VAIKVSIEVRSFGIPKHSSGIYCRIFKEFGVFLTMTTGLKDLYGIAQRA